MNKRNQRIIQKVTTFLTLALFVTAAMPLAAKARKSSANTNSTSAPSANMVSQTPTYRFRHKVSKGNLTQYDMGTTNRLEATVWPEDNADGVKWILQDAGNGYTYFINKESGLVLSTNGENLKNNFVGLWPRVTPNHDGQLWKMEKAPSGDYMMTNKARGTGLTQYDGGKSSRREATVWPGQTVNHPDFLWSMEPAGNADMLKLTIQEVKCISPSTGQDAGTSALFAGLGAAIAVAVTVGTAGAATPITAMMVASAVASGAGGGGTAQKVFGNKLAGRDDLMIKVNGRKVWPANRNDMPIDSQQTIAVNSQYIYESSRGANLELWEYDSGSADDNLGSSMIKGVGLPYEEELVIANKSEGSFYLVKVKVESLSAEVKVMAADVSANVNPISNPPQTNVALGKNATQSSNYAVLSSADKAVDGKTDGNFANGAVTHTNNEFQPWWMVDLGTVYTISRIDLYNRTDCCQERLKDFLVYISQDGTNWTAFAPPAANATPYGYSIPINPALARYVQVRLNGTGILSLAEVKVIAADVSANVKPVSNPLETQGGIAKLTRQQLEDEFRTSPEAQQHGESTDKDFTISLYWRYLGHAPDGNLQLHTARITNGQLTRQQLEDEFRTSPEAQQHGVSTTIDFTTSLYWRYLGHAPDGNMQYHANRLIAGGTSIPRGSTVYTGCGYTYKTKSARDTQCGNGGTSIWIGDDVDESKMSRGQVVYTGCGYTYASKNARDTQCGNGGTSMWIPE